MHHYHNIKANYESAKYKIKKDIQYHIKDQEEKKELYIFLKSNKWQTNNYLRRKIRRHWKRGHNHTYNQLIVPSDKFVQKEKNGVLWISIPSLIKGSPIWIPLTQTKRLPEKIKGNKNTKGSNLRLILKDNIVEIHYSVEQEVIKNCSGTKTLGIDKGYSEVFMDSEGTSYGNNLGKVLSSESDYLKIKYQHRNRLRSIAKKKPEKANTIFTKNLGKKELNQRQKRFQSKIKTIIYTAAHQLIKKTNTVIAEDLTSPIANRKFGKNINRRLSSWTKGIFAVLPKDMLSRQK